MANEMFKKYHARIAREGWLKALLCGLVIACGVLALTELISWFVGFRAGLWIGIALFFVAAGAGTPMFYYFKFRPTTKEIAKRVDELGLEERVLTMVEYENDDSYIAQKQREDTKNALGRVDHMLLKIAVSVSLIAAVAVTGAVGLGMTAVDSLHYAGVLPSGLELLSGETVLGQFTINYTVQGGEGAVLLWDENWGNETQVSEALIVEEGQNAPAVIAVPAAQWVFVGWSDGKTSPYRQDLAVRSDLSVAAIFEEVSETVDQDAVPPELNSNSQQTGSAPQGPPQPGSSGDEMENDLRDAANNQINNGSTFYGDEFSENYGDMMDRLGGDDNIPEDLKGFIKDYFDSIAQDDGEGEE